MKKLLVLLIVFAAIGGGGYYLLRGPVETVELIEVQRGDIVVMLAEDGNVVALNQSDVAFKTGGRVDHIMVEEGDEVKCGMVLAKLDDRELVATVKQAEAAVSLFGATLQKLKKGAREEELERVKAELDAAKCLLREGETAAAQAEADYQRAKKLHGGQVLSDDIYEKAKTARDRASHMLQSYRAKLDAAQAAYELLVAGAREEDIAAAEAQVKQAEAQLELVKANLDNATLRSPLDGKVTRRLVDVGETIAPGIPVFSIIDPKNVEIELQVDQADIGDIKPGFEVLVTADAYPNREFKGEISRIVPHAELKMKAGIAISLDEEDLIFRARVRVPDLKGELLPGMKIDGRVIIGINKDVLLLPRQCTFIENGKWYVWTMKEQELEKRLVERGRQDYTNVEITDGLSEGEGVVQFRKATFEEGMRVDVKQ